MQRCAIRILPSSACTLAPSTACIIQLFFQIYLTSQDARSPSCGTHRACGLPCLTSHLVLSRVKPLSMSEHIARAAHGGLSGSHIRSDGVPPSFSRSAAQRQDQGQTTSRPIRITGTAGAIPPSRERYGLRPRLFRMFLVPPHQQSQPSYWCQPHARPLRLATPFTTTYPHKRSLGTRSTAIYAPDISVCASYHFA